MTTIESFEQASGRDVAPDFEGPRLSVVSLAIRDKAGLRNAYMSYISGGGLFFPTTRRARIGEELYLILAILEDPTRYSLTARVIWVTPAGSSGRPQGLGIQFVRGEISDNLRLIIEYLIGQDIDPMRPSHTV